MSTLLVGPDHVGSCSALATACCAWETPEEADELDDPLLLEDVPELDPEDAAEEDDDDELLLPHAATNTATTATNNSEARPLGRLI